MKYKFIPQIDSQMTFDFEAKSFDEAVEMLQYDLQCHDEWKVVKHENGEMGVDVFLKNYYIDTLLCSESPDKEDIKKNLLRVRHTIGATIRNTCNVIGCADCLWGEDCMVRRLQDAEKKLEKELD